MSDYKVNIGKSINICIIEKGIKKRELAQDMQVCNATVSNWMAGSCPLDKVIILANYFDIKPSVFISRGEWSE